MPFGDIARAIETGQTAGLLKVLIDPDSERLLGARIVGAEAGELIHVFAARDAGGGIGAHHRRRTDGAPDVLPRGCSRC